jgi:NAD(P)-dependent dehydrogenase (short-subunit alcohol dehydrogenase family)
VDLEGKVAIVTGGTRGIGRRIALALVEEGADVFICGRDPKGVIDAATELDAASGDRADALVADVRDPAGCRAIIEAAVDNFGGIDILVNNAGIGIFKPVAEMSVEEWRAVIETNLSAPFYMAREAIPHMKRRGGGHIIQISSLAGVNAFPGGAAYNASKFGLNGFSEALMQEVRQDGIRVTTILPGSVATDFGGSGESGADWKLHADDVALAVIDVLRFPSRAIASRVDLRPSRPPMKK